MAYLRYGIYVRAVSRAARRGLLMAANIDGWHLREAFRQ